MSYMRRLLERAERENEERMRKRAEEEREWQVDDDQVPWQWVCSINQANTTMVHNPTVTQTWTNVGTLEVDEIARMRKSTILESLVRLCDEIETIYTRDYLRKPTPRDLQRLLQKTEARGFPNMIGSIDYMHWQWKNCPTA
ncbi:unnamed protein product [Prunus armeniaca]